MWKLGLLGPPHSMQSLGDWMSESYAKTGGPNKDRNRSMSLWNLLELDKTTVKASPLNYTVIASPLKEELR